MKKHHDEKDSGGKGGAVTAAKCIPDAPAVLARMPSPLSAPRIVMTKHWHLEMYHTSCLRLMLSQLLSTTSPATVVTMSPRLKASAANKPRPRVLHRTCSLRTPSAPGKVSAPVHLPALSRSAGGGIMKKNGQNSIKKGENIIFLMATSNISRT